MAVFLIVFREFMESFLLISILLGFSKKQNLHRERSILGGGILGMVLSLLITVLVFYVLPGIHVAFPPELIDTFGHVSIIVSGAVLLYITYRIHPYFSSNKNAHVASLMQSGNVARVSFFIPSFLLVLQEGFEIVFFTTTASFSGSFRTNIVWLFLGFAAAASVSALLYRTYLANHIPKLFRITEYAFIAYGIYLVVHGSMELAEQLLH